MTIAATCAVSEVSRRPSYYRAEQYDSDLGLYYLRARYYNPATGRFLSRDPLAGDPADPKTLHKYLYANGDPVDLLDPTGRATYVKPTWGNAAGEYLGLINSIAIRTFTFTQITVPIFLATPQGKALLVLAVTTLGLGLANTCDFLEFTEFLDDAFNSETRVTPPSTDCNEQPHPYEPPEE
jgi:RHS repeat-associated protein